jgi:DNA primase
MNNLISSNIDRDKIEYIKQVVDPVLVASALGIRSSRSTDYELRGACPVHGGDNQTAFSLNLQSGYWSCFSHNCHEGHSDIIGLVQAIRRCSFHEAINFLANLAGVDLASDVQPQMQKTLARKETMDFIKRTERSSELNLCPIINLERQLPTMIADRNDYFLTRGYSIALQDYFEIGSYKDRYQIPRASIPIRDANGGLVAIDGRRIDNDDEPRYFIQPAGFSKGKVLYHYHLAKDYIRVFDGVLFIVEGYKACWSMVKSGFYNTVACMGAGLTANQPQILASDIHIRKLVIILDGDTAGKNGARRSKRLLSHICDVEVVDLPNDQDPSTLDPADLTHIVNQYL